MKMNKQTRTFARQVQVDLLALSDANIHQTIEFWVNGGPSGSPIEVPEETRSALGYTRKASDPEVFSHSAIVANELETRTQWLAPAPQQLRRLLTEMEVQIFVQHVLPLAFQALHLTHLEWGEGTTFNAHLANHLRSIGIKR
jgi:hypothetical protein